MITDEKMREIRLETCNMTNSQLKELIAFAEHELRLSEQAIEEGMEVRE